MQDDTTTAAVSGRVIAARLDRLEKDVQAIAHLLRVLALFADKERKEGLGWLAERLEVLRRSAAELGDPEGILGLIARPPADEQVDLLQQAS
jgi:hypothetical protein